MYGESSSAREAAAKEWNAKMDNKDKDHEKKQERIPTQGPSAEELAETDKERLTIEEQRIVAEARKRSDAQHDYVAKTGDTGAMRKE